MTNWCYVICHASIGRHHDRVDRHAKEEAQTQRQNPPINTCAGMPIGPEKPLRLAPNRSASYGADEACACFVAPVRGAALALWLFAPSERPPKMSLLLAALPC